eukprot:4955667-Prymnesium_polylepis.1
MVKSNNVLLDALRAIASFAPATARLLPASQRAEVAALAALLGQPFDLLWRLQFVYEAFALTDVGGGMLGCTSAAFDCDDGVVHGRTLDWSLLAGLHALVVNLDVRRAGEPLYRCTSLVGFVGVLTGMRADAYSLSVSSQ